MRAHRSALFATLFALTLTARVAQAAWPHDPAGDGLLLRGAQTQAYGLSSSPDGAGGAFYVWDESFAIYAQHVDAHGRLLWGPGGLVVATGLTAKYYPSVSADGTGGAIVAWEDQRAGNFDVYAQRVNSAGAAQWTANGVAMVTQVAQQTTSRVVSDGAGGAFVAWVDQRSGSTRIYGRLVSAAGAPAGADGIELGTSASGLQSEHQLVRAASGNFVVAWRDSRADAGDLHYQFVAPNGVPGSLPSYALCVAAGTQFDVRLAADAFGGVVAAWTDTRSGGTDVYASRLGSGLTPLWSATGVAVCTTPASQSAPTVATDGAGGAIVAWSDSRNAPTGTDVYAQRVTAAGLTAWALDGVAVCTATGNQGPARAVADAAGGVLLVWSDLRMLDTSNLDLYAQRLSGSGTAQWTGNGLPLSSSFRSVVDVSVCDDGRGGLLIGWSAPHAPSGNKAAVARIDEFGVLGGEPVIASVKDVPNDQGGLVKLSFAASPLDTDPLYRNIGSYWLYRSAPPNAAAALRQRGAAFATPAAVAGTGAPPRWLQTRVAAQDYYWELAASVTATRLSAYSEVLATTGDSLGGSNPRTAFMVMARSTSGTQWWTSAPDSGYSVDNLPPAAPAPFTGQYAAGTARLHWDPNGEPDVAGYELYRGTSAGFAPSPANLVSAQPDTGYADAAGAPYFYKLLAVDAHGNKSPVATLAPTGTLAVDGAPPAAFFAPPAPNPARAGGTLRFGLANAGAVRLALFDAQGRLVRTLASGRFAAGEHAVAFDGRDDGGRRLAPGLYLARLTAPGFAVTHRLAVVD